MLIPNFSKDNFYLPDIAADSSPKRKMGNPFKSNSSIPIDDKNSKMYRKLQPITSNFFENINDINNKLNSIDTVRKHYYGDDSELSKKKIQQILKSENYFFKEDESQKNNKAMKYLYYANVGLSTSQSLMKAITSFLRANEKIYNVPDRCKNTQKLFLKDLMGKIMNDLKPADIESSKKFLQGDF